MQLRSLIHISIALIFSFQAVSQQVSVHEPDGSIRAALDLFSIRSGAISDQVSIQYSGKGASYFDYISQAGQGWELNAGGAVTRQLKDLPDEHPTGWLNQDVFYSVNAFIPEADDNYSVFSDEIPDFEFLNSLYGSEQAAGKDTEPDLFHVNAPGLNLTFLFGQDSSIHFLNYTDARVEYTIDPSGKISGFTIHTSGGLTYFFNQAEGQTYQTYKSSSTPEALLRKHYYNFKAPVAFNTRWYLTRVTSVDGGDLWYEYSNEAAETYTAYWAEQYYDTLYHFFYDPLQQEYFRRVIDITRVSEDAPLVLERISNGIQSVAFEYGGMYFPLTTVDDDGRSPFRKPLLREVRFESLGLVSQTFLLDYTYMSVNQKLFPLLKTVTRSGELPFENPIIFDYYNLPSSKPLTAVTGSVKGKPIFDPFGYLNSTATEDSLISFYIYPEEDPDNRIRYELLPDTRNFVKTIGHDATPDMLYAQSGLLKSITNELGGKTIITYELNEYYDQTYDTDLYGGGLRVSEVRRFDGADHASDLVTSYEYDLVNGHSSGVLTRRPVYAYSLGSYLDRNTNTLLPDSVLQSPDLSPAERTRSKYTYLVYPAAQGYTQYSRISKIKKGIARNVTSYRLKDPYLQDVFPETRLARGGYGASEAWLSPEIRFSNAFPFAPNLSTHHLAVELTAMETYDAEDQLRTQISYAYEDFNSAPDTLYALSIQKAEAFFDVSHDSARTFLYSRYPVTLSPMRTVSQSSTVTFDELGDSTRTINQYYYRTGAPYTLSESRNLTATDTLVNRWRYVSDYDLLAYTGDDEWVLTLKALNSLRIDMPVEQAGFKVVNSQEYLTGASLSTYSYDGRRLSPDRSWHVDEKYVTDFDLSVIKGDSLGKYSGYREKVSFIQPTLPSLIPATGYHNTLPRFVSTVNHLKQKSTVLYGHQSLLPVMEVSNASVNQVGYTGFENQADAPEYAFVYDAAGLLPEGGRFGTRAFKALPDHNVLTTSLSREGQSTFRLGFWYRSPGGTNQVVLTLDPAGLAQQVVIGLDQTDEWTYLSKSIDMTSLPENILIEVEVGVNAEIDEPVLTPADAVYQVIHYDKKLRRSAVSGTGGRAEVYEYNGKGELAVVRDESNHIIQVHNSSLTMTETDTSFLISVPREVIVGEQATFGSLTRDSGFDYYWKVVEKSGTTPLFASQTDFSGIADDDHTFTYTFTGSGTYYLFLKATDGSAAYYSEKLVYVVKPKLSIESICLSGIVRFDVCGTDPSVVSGTCGTATAGESKIEVTTSLTDVTYKFCVSEGGPNFLSTCTPAYSGSNNYYSFEPKAIEDIFVKVSITKPGYSAASEIIRIEAYRSDVNCGVANQ